MKKTEGENLDLDYAVVLPKTLADELFDQLQRTVEYYEGDLTKVRVFGKWHPIPRQQVAYGDEGMMYTFSGATIPAKPWSSELNAVRNLVAKITGFTYNFVLVNRYRNGNDRMGEHKDDEKELDPNTPIASLTLGQTRTFVLKHGDARKKGDGKRNIPPVKIDLEHGSLLLMNPPTNDYWYHSLPPRKLAVGVIVVVSRVDILSFKNHYLVVSDIYGTLAVFHLSKIVQTEANLAREDLTPKNRITVKKDFQINSLLSLQSHLIVGCVGEIFAYSWKVVKTSKNPQPAWTIDIPNQKDSFERTDVNSLQFNSESSQIYAGCGDNNIYVFDLETRKLLKTLSKHTDYIHCLMNRTMVHQDFYNTVLSQAFSPCGNYLVVSDIYGTLAVFHLSKIVQTEANLAREDLTPKNRITVKKDFQINSLLSLQSHLIVGCVGEIFAYSWKVVKTSKNPQPAWTIDIPNQKDSFERTDVNSLQFNSESSQIYAGCGDNNIYVFDLETRKLLKTLSKHTDYIHCLMNRGNDLISGGEDGIVNIWDLRSYKVSNKIEPNTSNKVARPDVGKWIGAVSSNEDYVLCGGGPRLSLWHYRFLTNSTVFPIDDKGIHVAEILNEKILAGGRCKLFYQMSFLGDIVSEIPVSSVTVYSAIHHTEPFEVLSIAGSSPKIDICNNFMYKNQQLSLY
ncbi:hypothetical protein JTB14_032799 [Gonioctena quinquepunctata]|nr:hypothetical protein JTB14_032799 [Gonioctena quinquepunctata]